MKTIKFDKKTNISIYDNEGKTFDRITIVLNNTKQKPLFGGKYYDYECIAASLTGSGFFLTSSCQKGRHLGKKINFSQLTQELQNKIKNYLKY